MASVVVVDIGMTSSPLCDDLGRSLGGSFVSWVGRLAEEAAPRSRAKRQERERWYATPHSALSAFRRPAVN